MIPVNLFNASTLAVTVQVNQASTPVRIGPTSGTIQWNPQPALPGSVNLIPSGPPGPNVLAVGPNTLAITPQGSTIPTNFTINIPGTPQWTSMQIYIFFNTTDTFSWMILNGGSYVTGSIPK